MNNSVPKDWQVSKIGELIQKVIDNRGKTPPLSDKGKELIEINCIENYKFPNYDLIKKYVSNKTYNSWFRGGHPKKGDILVSTVGSIGQFSIMNDNRGCIAQNIIAITPKKNICNDYLYYACSSDIIKKAISSVLMGAVQPSLKVPDFLAINLHLPSLPEQKKIAFILTSVDEVIEKTQLQINKLQDLKKGMMDELLTKGIGHAEFKDSELGRIPKSWDIVSLDSVSKIIMGQSPNSSSYNNNRVGLPFFQGKTDFGDYFPMARIWCSKPLKVAPVSSILLTVRAPVGDINITKEECCIGRGLAAIQAESINSDFLFENLKFLKNKFNFYSQGTTFEAINQSDLKSFKIMKPSLSEQKKIITILKSINNNASISNVYLKKIVFLKKSLMQDLLTGKVRVSVN